MIIILENIISDFMKKNQFSHYTEIRAQVNQRQAATLVDGVLQNNVSLTSKGVSSRIYREGNYGFASVPDYSEEGIKRVLKKASENSEFLYGKGKVRKPDFEKFPGFSEENGFDMERELTQRYLIDFAKETDDYISQKYPDLLSRTVTCEMLSIEKLFCNTDMAESHSLTPRSLVAFELILEGNDGQPVSIYHNVGGLGTFTVVHTKPSDVFGEIDEIYIKLKEKAEGVYCRPGMRDVILASDLAGILAHEAVGHTTEADFVRAGSVAKDLMGKKVASDLVTLIDYAHHDPEGKICPMPVFVDDEGILAEDAVIIEDGVLKAYMHNKESAQDMGYKPQGNARANEYYDEPLIRMRNTCIVPGKSSEKDMIESIEDGYYFSNTTNGQADSTGEFMFGVAYGYEIKNGKKGKAVKDTTISGMAFDVLKNVSMVSDDLTWLSGGWCGKKQMILVGMGGPAIKTRLNVGGR